MPQGGHDVPVGDIWEALGILGAPIPLVAFGALEGPLGRFGGPFGNLGGDAWRPLGVAFGRFLGVARGLGDRWGALQGAWEILKRVRWCWGALGPCSEKAQVDFNCISAYQKRCSDGR